MQNKDYTVKKLSEMASISIRTLHHYDQIGLLKPNSRSEVGYRLYSSEDLKRLQQILFYKELDFSLQEIKLMLDAVDFDPEKAFVHHRKKLLARKERLGQLIALTDTALKEFKGEMIMQDEQRFTAFGKQKVEENEQKYGKEIREKYGDDIIDKSNAVVGKLQKEEFEQLEQQSAELLNALNRTKSKGANSPEAQDLIQRYIAHLSKFANHVYSPEALRVLGQTYVEDKRFNEYYEKIAPNFAEYVRDCMLAFADQSGQQR